MPAIRRGSRAQAGLDTAGLKLLFDQNLAPRLVAELEHLFRDPSIRAVGLSHADDLVVWEHAKRHGYTIVSKDADFHQMSLVSALAFATLLLAAGAGLTRRDPLLRSTPLGWACRWGRGELAKLLIERGAAVDETDAEAWATPLAWAAGKGHDELTALLRRHGARC